MTTPQDYALEPCPFCGEGETSIRENGKIWTGMKFSEPASVSVLHHCAPVEGHPSRFIERVGRDLESAVAAWNRRAPQSGWLPISEAPRDGTRVILAWGGKSINGYYLDNSKSAVPWEGWRVESMVVQPRGQPTHYQLFPLPPSTKGEPHA